MIKVSKRKLEVLFSRFDPKFINKNLYLIESVSNVTGFREILRHMLFGDIVNSKNLKQSVFIVRGNNSQIENKYQ